MNTIVIPTAQHIELEYPVAKTGERVLGALIDAGVLALYVYLWARLLTLYEADIFRSIIDQTDETYASLSLAVLTILPAACYSLVTEWIFNGRSLGKLVMNTQTVRLDGSAPSLGDLLIRWLLRLVDVWIILPFYGLPGLIALSASPRGQRLGDMAAGTTVIRLKLVASFVNTIYVETEEDYQVVFPEISALSDRDVSILKEVLDAGLKSNNPSLLLRLAARVKEVTGIRTEMEPRAFLETLLRDYNHYFRRD
jgi:uncharacterized RDD family membrane protein YckC